MAGESGVSDEKPVFVDYEKWLSDTFEVSFRVERTRYERESLRIKVAAEQSDFWRTYQVEKQDRAELYYAATTYPLFSDASTEQLLVKPWSSFIEKTYRVNIKDNPHWPLEPDGGWLLPKDWYSRVHDIVRTSIVVKYLDGVGHIAEYLRSLAGTLAIPDFECTFEARDTGYYAAHSRIGVDFNVLVENWTEVETHGQFEIQITTQLQEVIRRLTHTEYESRRMREAEPAVKWQWDYASEAFKPNYLGHMLHYLEGMIMEVRDRGPASV